MSAEAVALRERSARVADALEISNLLEQLARVLEFEDRGVEITRDRMRDADIPKRVSQQLRVTGVAGFDECARFPERREGLVVVALQPLRFAAHE